MTSQLQHNMNLCFNEELAKQYKSNSQKIRVMSETWMSDNMFCPCCGNDKIIHMQNNKPVADFYCKCCDNIFELKSSGSKLGKKIVDGSYKTMIERIESDTNPNLFVLEYKVNQIINLRIIPKYFFTPQIIEKRKPLSPNSRRAGWIGCNILYSEIPLQGKINIIENSIIYKKSAVIDLFAKTKSLYFKNLTKRTWLMDILECINKIPTDEFTLKDMYAFCDLLAQKHKNNNNIKAKIRQQLQILRDKKYLLFLGNGYYKKLHD